MIGNKMKQVNNVLNNMAQDLTGSGNFKPVIVLSPEAFDLTSKTVKGDYVQEGKWKLLADQYSAEKITAEMLAIPKKGDANPFEKLQNQVRDAIKSGFSKEVQAIIAKEAKALDDVSKGIKSHWLKQVGSKFSKVQEHILASDLKNDVITMQRALALYPEKAKKYQDNQDKKKGANKVKPVPKEPKGKVAYYLDLAIRSMQTLEKTDTNITQDIKALRLVEAKYK
jgi:hypothetical protein